MMSRRELLLLRPARGGAVELSCERLYMRYLEARADGTTAQLARWLEHELGAATELRLRDPAWLAAESLGRYLEPLLDSFRARGGRVCR